MELLIVVLHALIFWALAATWWAFEMRRQRNYFRAATKDWYGSFKHEAHDLPEPIKKRRRTMWSED